MRKSFNEAASQVLGSRAAKRNKDRMVKTYPKENSSKLGF